MVKKIRYINITDSNQYTKIGNNSAYVRGNMEICAETKTYF